ncbi:MAG TPA: gamma-glutamyl-gamma-aminobutyrate hydrolase family protein, partial [Candidatus Eisenbacteria bacterium]|nr:gamma-glutamyl-gamma-aminobutyrate hydrolase family protein [Candidatus Eisenbacteria bacterium]
TKKGGTMRLGAYTAAIEPGSRASSAYQKAEVSERHRHRFEFNNDYRERLESKGLRVTGLYQDLSLVEIVELKDHPWFVGVQFHPELKSRPDQPHPLFRGFIAAANEERLRRASASGAPAAAEPGTTSGPAPSRGTARG